MTQRAEFDKIELSLIRVLHTLITERSVSRAALRLHSSQPAVSAQLKRLRELTGDPLLVRAGNEMTPTETALQLVGPASALLHEAEQLFGRRSRASGFDAAKSDAMFRVAASDYLDPLFLPRLVAHVKRAAPGVRLELLPLSGDFDYRRHLASGDVDLVIGNWLEPPGPSPSFKMPPPSARKMTVPAPRQNSPGAWRASGRCKTTRFWRFSFRLPFSCFSMS